MTGVTPNKMFIVVDPSQERHWALERAIVSAKAYKEGVPSLHIFVSVDMDHTDTSCENEALYKGREWFTDLSAKMEEAGLQYEIEICWSSDWLGSIHKSSLRAGADFIVSPLNHPASGRRIAVRDADWRLMRTAQCPILVVQPGGDEKRKVFLAAVNFQTHKPAYERLNKAIIERAHRGAGLYGAELHFVNAYSDSLHYPDRAVLAKETGVDTSQIHVKHGAPEDVIAETAAELNADIVVIGTQNRSSRWRGNTVEKIFFKVSSDIMVINDNENAS